MVLGPTLENGGGGTDGGTLDLEGREDDDRGSIGGERVPTFGSPAEAARAGEFGPTQAAQAGRVGGERPRTFDSPAEAEAAGEFDDTGLTVTGGTSRVWPTGDGDDPTSRFDRTVDGETVGAGGEPGASTTTNVPDVNVDIPQFPEFPEFPEFGAPDIDLAGPAAILGVFVVVAVGVYALAANIPGAVAGR